METDLSKTAWDTVSDSYIRLLQITPIDVQLFGYLKYLQWPAVSTLFEGSVKPLVRQTFKTVIGAVSKDLERPPENGTGYVGAGSTLETLLDVLGEDGLEDPESSNVRL